ncbi:protein NRT1/ PTR FAMILY 5.6-like [Magnolia sinica]|uniref:protein NRT1/ PTR FAMILY 5.6-like n=1 Tax=Magnolia sinica TaxID=86752 RepID=UPI00265ACC8C|nr:protein NRT1/ PTR FAMILY 5.6-like [Magnolia sinica]
MDREMEREIEKKGRAESQVDKEKWVCDSSVDYRGKPPLRASTGVWKASLFIIAIEFSERLSYFGIATNLIIYLTKILHQDLKTAAKNVNYWAGVTTMMPLIGGFLADAYLGRFSAVLISSIIYLMGLGLLTMSQFIPALKPCTADTCHRSTKLHEVIFFMAMYLITVGTGGHKPSLESFGADQFDDDHDEERRKKMSYFNWWNSALCAGLVLGVTIIVYVQDNVSWGVADLILTVIMAITIVIFLLGRPFYRYRAPKGSPLTPMLQVLVAAVAKRNLPYPSSPTQLYELPKSRNATHRFLSHTNKLRFLDKAAVIESDGVDIETQSGYKQNPWRLATLTNVEETKLVLNMVPIWITSLPFGICIAQTSTFFIKQGSTMERRVAGNFVLPPASIYCFAAFAMITTVCIYDKVLVPILRRATGNERGISILQRIGIGMTICTVGMVAAAIVEHKRLGVAHREVGPTGTVAMSVFWLAPQFMILGIGDGFALVGLQEYFYDQGPDSMRSMGIAFYLSVIGAANFLSSLLITIADRLTEKNGSSGWFAKGLNKSHLDYFYWLLAAMGGANLCVYAYFASRFPYKNVEKRVVDADGYQRKGVGPTS